MGLIDTVESMNNDFNTKFNALQQELAVGSSIGTTSGNPFYVQDSSVNTSIKSVYDFMRTETMAHYKTYKSNSDLTNTLLAELIKVTEDVWDHSGYLDVDDAIRQSNSDLQMSISESFDEFIDELKKQQDGAISELQAVLDERNAGSLGSDEVPDLNPGKSSGWKSMMGSAVKAGVSFLGTQIVTAIADAATKFSQLNADRYDLMAELFENYEGMTEAKAMQIATDEMTGKGHRDYTQWTRQEQLELKQFNEDFARSIGIMQRNWERQRQITRQDEKRQWGQEATLSAAQVFKIPSLIGAAKDTIYDMERRMPGLNLQATEFFKTMTAVFDKTGEMGRETFEEISKLSRNLMVDPNTLLQISDTYSRYIKLMTKGGKDFQKQMTNVLKITAKLEDQFVNADGVMGEVMDLALTPIYEMSEEQLTRAQLQAKELGMSIQEWQTYAQTDMAGAAEAIVNADRSYIERVGIDITDGLQGQEFGLLDQFGIKGDKIIELMARGNADLSKADEKLNADTGTDIGLMEREFELSNELYEFGKQLDQMYWDHGIALEDRHWNKLQDAERKEFDFMTEWHHTYLTNWDKMERWLDNWLLRNPILKAIDDFLMTISMGKWGLGHVVTGTALTAGGAMLWKTGKSMFGSGGAGAAGAGGAGSAAATGGSAAGTLGTTAVPALASGTAIVGGLYSGYQGTKNYAAGQELYSGETGNANSKSAGAWKMAGGTAQMAGGALATAAGVAAISGSIAGSNFWNPIGWAAALVAVGTGAVAVGARLESMGDACGTLNVVLDDQKEQLEANIHSQRTQYTSLQGELENYASEHNKLSGMSEETRGELFSLTEQLKTGTIDQQTYNLAVKQLASEDQSSGALDILASTIAGDGGTTANLGWLNQSLDTLAVGDDSKMMALTVAMTSLTTATEKQRDAALDFAEKILNKQRNEEAKQSGEDLALRMSQAFQTAIDNEDWAGAEAIIQDLEKMGVDSKHIEWRMNHGKYAKGSGNEYEGIDSDEIYDLVKGGFWSGVETTQERISSGNLDAHNEVASKYGASTVISDEELANNAQVIAGVNSYFETIGYNQLKSYRAAGNNAKLHEQIKLANDMGILKKLKLKSKGNLDDSELQLISSATGIPTGSFAKGSASLPSDMIAQVHQGERIIPAESNDELGANIATQVELETLTNDLLTTSNISSAESNELSLIQNELSTIGNDSLSTISDERLTKLDSDTLTFNSTMSTALSSQLAESQLERQTLDTDLKDILSELKDLNKGFEPFWQMVDDAANGEKANAEGFGYGEGSKSLESNGSTPGSSISNPFSSYPVTSPFGMRDCPFHGRELHNGVDFGMPMGTPLYSFDNGKVTRNSYDANGAGNFVEIENSSGYKYIFMHMQERSPLGIGQSVSIGQKIGNSGSTGASTGPHLHLTVRDPSGTDIDPLQYFEGGYTVSKSYEMNALQELLAKIGIIDAYGMSLDGDNIVVGPLGAIDYSFLKSHELRDGLSLDAYGHYNKVGPGEWAYGPYQYTAKGSMDNTAALISWMKSHGYSDIARDLGNGSVSGHDGALGSLWKAAYNKYGRRFKEAQDFYQYDAYTTNMLTSYPFLSNFGPQALGVFAGWINWMGSGGLSSVIRRAGGSSATLQQLFDARASYIRSLNNYGNFRDGWETRMRDEAAYVGVAAHKTGLSRVPYDEYPALLHKDERVLNAEEARMWNDYRANEHAVANYDPEIQEVYVSVDTDGVIDAVEALTAIVDDIYKLLKPKSTAQQTVTPRRSSNSIADYV